MGRDTATNEGYDTVSFGAVYKFRVVDVVEGLEYDTELAWVRNDSVEADGTTEISYRLPTGVYQMGIFVWVDNYLKGVLNHTIPLTVNTCGGESINHSTDEVIEIQVDRSTRD